MLSATTPLSQVEGASSRALSGLERLKIFSVADLLTHYPRRYENRRETGHFPESSTGEDAPICVAGMVHKTGVRRLKNRKAMFEIEVREKNATVLGTSLICRWFNAFYVQKMILAGQHVVFFAKAQFRQQKIVMVHPDFEIIENDGEESIHFNRIVPIYPSTEGLTQRAIRSLAYRVLLELDKKTLPGALPDKLSPISHWQAIRQVHFPDSEESARQAREHLSLSELFAMQLVISSRRVENAKKPGESHVATQKILGEFLRQLPFELTGAQRRALREVEQDMASARPMNRLLQGDVGSGKTVVAISAMLLAVEAGFQAALMAPTQILAEQHYLTCSRWLKPLGIRVALRTADRVEEDFLPLFENDYGEQAQIIIGTHALLYESAGELTRLGLVIIDEQHKFGVAQRSRFIARGSVPDILVMTATPIPRTLAMTLYGDLDISVIDEIPGNRGKIITAVRETKKLPAIIQFIRQELEAGRQAYIVYPLVEDSEVLDLKAATTEFKNWEKHLHPHYCALLHGRMAQEDKETTMQRFREQSIQVLVATTVIEVGIDVPNATIMLIENAERFGLAQIHQLRGRIGRGAHKSYCILLSDTKAETAREKLNTLEQTLDGFEIAEADLRLRGAGDLLGTAQSGLPPLKIAELGGDRELMQRARAAAIELMESDPDLESPEHRSIKQLLETLKADAAQLCA